MLPITRPFRNICGDEINQFACRHEAIVILVGAFEQRHKTQVCDFVFL